MTLTGLEDLAVLAAVGAFAAVVTHRRGLWGGASARLPVTRPAKRQAAKTKAPKPATAQAGVGGWRPARPRKQRAAKTGASAAQADGAQQAAAAGKQGGPAQPSRRSLFQRLVIPQGRAPAPATPPPAATPATPAAATPAAPAVPATPSGGPPVTTPPPPPPASGPSAGGGAASDLFSALHRYITHLRSGGIRRKIRGHLVIGEGLGQQATILEQYARYLREERHYTSAAWEPVQQAAAMARGAQMKLTESANYVASVARTPAGELNGHAPHRDELNTE